MTPPEVTLWQALRGQKQGARFRRQHPIGPFILDFWCESARLAVEIDGQTHDHPDQARRDVRRTEWLIAQGIRVWRVAASDVLSNLDGVLAALRDLTNPPPSGEESEAYCLLPTASPSPTLTTRLTTAA